MLDFPPDFGTDIRPARSGDSRSLWAKNPSTPLSDDGTRLDADWVNAVTGLLRNLASSFGVSPTDGDDSALSNAVAAAVAQYAAVVTASLSLKAPLDSPLFTGTPSAPNQSAGANNTMIANTAYVDGAIAQLAAIVSGALVFKGEWDASTGIFPGSNSVKKGWFYKVGVAGVVDGVSFSVGDDVYAVVDSPSTSTYAANWLKIEGMITLSEVQAAVGFTFGSLAALSSITASLISDASANGRSLITAADYTAMKSLLAIAAADISDASANGRSLIKAANYAAMKALLATAVSDLSDSAWTAWTPTLTTGSGSLTTAAPSGCRYKQIGKTVHINGFINITTNGTGAIGIYYTLPVTPFNTSGIIGSGRVNVPSGVMLANTLGQVATVTKGFLLTYNNSYPGSDGAQIFFEGTYEAA